jgi:exopolyphosphatase / guanosine-5'-triphosphate,3'-diphosphate pyrophosphatase
LALQGKAAGNLAKAEVLVRDALSSVTWLKHASGPTFYMVGGSWRALCHLHMHLVSHPLPIIHAYSFQRGDIDKLMKASRNLDKKAVKAIPNLTERRLPSLPLAAMALKEASLAAGADRLTASAYGLREGILFTRLSQRQRQEDPFLAACRAEARIEGRFPEHADQLMDWMDELFAGHETPEDGRLRRAACLLSDTSWRGHPDFRAERALNGSLYGNWVGVDARGRMMVGLALYVCYGGDTSGPVGVLARRLLSQTDIFKAEACGLALRLGQRLTGGTGAPLRGARLLVRGADLVLSLEAAHAGLYGEVVQRRLESLAQYLKLKPKFEVTV